MNKKKVILSILTVLILVGVGVVLAMNPFNNQDITKYNDVVPEGFPNDFPIDPNLVKILKSQKIIHPDGQTEFIYGYTTIESQEKSFQKVIEYALSKNPGKIYTGNGTDENGNDTRYFSVENSTETNKIDANILIMDGSSGEKSYVEINILTK